MPERRYLTFDMDNARHREAFSAIGAQPGRLKSEYVIGCILQAEQENRLEFMIRKYILEAIAGVSHLPAGTAQPMERPKPTEDLSDLPEDLLFAMDDTI